MTRRDPVQERSKIRYNKILDAALSLLKREGLKSFRASELAKEAGMSVGALYQYFDSTDTILSILIDKIMEDELDIFHQYLSQISTETTPAQAIRKIYEHLLDEDSQNIIVRQLIVENLEKFHKVKNAQMLSLNIYMQIINFMRKRYNMNFENRRADMFFFVFESASKGIIRSYFNMPKMRLRKSELLDEINRLMEPFFTTP